MLTTTCNDTEKGVVRISYDLSAQDGGVREVNVEAKTMPTGERRFYYHGPDGTVTPELKRVLSRHGKTLTSTKRSLSSTF